MNTNNLIVVNGETENALGVLVYYSAANILVNKLKFQQIGMELGLSKFKPHRESAADAFRNATSSINERFTVKGASGQLKTYRIYCRDNKREGTEFVTRELVKETLNESTNNYKKLANIYIDTKTTAAGYDNVAWDDDVNVDDFCRRAIELFELYRVCYCRSHVDTVIESQLEQMNATKISIRCKMYFVPIQNMNLVKRLDEYLKAVNLINRRRSLLGKSGDGDEYDIVFNYLPVINDERQQQEMTHEFYKGFKKDIDFYMERIQHFIDTGATSDAVINRWLLKIDALQEKKRTYEAALQRELNDLNDDYDVLQLQSQELCIRTNEFQRLMCA